MNFAESTGQKSVTDLRREEVHGAHVENLRQAAQRMQEEDSRAPVEEFNFREEISERNLVCCNYTEICFKKVIDLS